MGPNVRCSLAADQGQPRVIAGGGVFTGDQEPRLELVTPNLTPDSATGRIARWSEHQFVARFRNGILIPQTVMPRTEFGRMSDGDLRAIPAVGFDPGPSLRPKQ